MRQLNKLEIANVSAGLNWMNVFAITGVLGFCALAVHVMAHSERNTSNQMALVDLNDLDGEMDIFYFDLV